MLSYISQKENPDNTAKNIAINEMKLKIIRELVKVNKTNIKDRSFLKNKLWKKQNKEKRLKVVNYDIENLLSSKPNLILLNENIYAV